MTSSERNLELVQMRLDDFNAAEAVIERGQKTFVEVGTALMAIRDGKGYRHIGFATFEAYVATRWGWTRAHGYQLMWAAQAATDVKTILHSEPTQTQALELARVPREERAAVVESLPKSITDYSTRELRQVISERRAEREVEAGPKPVPQPGSVKSKLAPLLRFCQADLATPTIVTLILRVFFPDAITALDMTYGSGAFWDGSAHVEVTGVDANPSRAVDGVADFRSLDKSDESFDVCIFDPPHIADAGPDSVMGQRFGTYADSELQDAIRAGAYEAMRVSRLGVVVKVTDHVHGQRFIRESGWVIAELGEPYDVVHQVRSNAMIDPKWEDQLSAYNNGSTYLIFRKGEQRHVRRNS